METREEESSSSQAPSGVGTTARPSIRVISLVSRIPVRLPASLTLQIPRVTPPCAESVFSRIKPDIPIL